MKSLREETNGQTRLLWHSNFWDGPLSGLMLWNGEKCWFDNIGERVEERPWSEEEIKEWVDYKTSISEEGDLDPDDYIDYDRYFVFKVYRIHPDLLEHLEYEHSLFQQNVGTHTDYDENGQRHHNL